MDHRHYPIKPSRNNGKSRYFDDLAEHSIALTESKQIVLKSSPDTIVKAERWLQVTMQTSSSGVRIGTRSGDVAQNTGFPIPTDSVVTIIISPNSQIYAAGPDGSALNVIVQPLPQEK